MAKGQKFRVEEWVHYSKLGRRRKKLIKYRKARGRDSKVRLKIKGHLRNVDVGFKKQKNRRGLIKEKIPVIIYNLNDLKNLKEKEIGILANVGNKKRFEIANYCVKHKIPLFNLKPELFLKKLEEEMAERRLGRENLQKKRHDKKTKKEEKKESETKEEKQNSEDKK